MTRPDGRSPHQMRPVKFEVGVQKDPPGSVLASFGLTRVLCTATLSGELPPWIQKKGSPHGWITAEYAMLPGSTPGRVSREGGGRWAEIQRLIGRSLRAAVELKALGPRLITIDCDVIQADGGTRTAAISGGWVALALALRKLRAQGVLESEVPLRGVCALSCAICQGQVLVDPCYQEDASAQADMNLVLDEEMNFIEIQATAEHGTFSEATVIEAMRLARQNASEIFSTQRKALL
jgi:ribonuclease PH